MCYGRINNNKKTEEKYIIMSSKKQTSKKKKVLKVLLGILIALLIIILAAGGTGFWYISNKFGKMQQVKIDESQLSVSDNKNLAQYRNIAIFGVDSRADDYGKGNRSDCIIIASINNKTHDVKLISVYRDTYVNISGHGLDKITHAYSYGEAPLALKTLNENLDLNIKEFVTVNFDSVSDAVDALGGIKMSVTDAEVRYINGYIDETSKVTGKKSNHITKAGTYNLDGVQAVAYSRIRYTAGGDYKRTERMRDVISAMLAKLKTKGVGEINKIADKVLPQVYTNLSMSDLISMAPTVASFNVAESIGWPYKTNGKVINKVWYGIPITLESNVERLHKEAFKDEEYVVPASIKTTSQQIVNKSGYSK